METTTSAVNAIGRVESVTNEICIVTGLDTVALNNVVEFSSGGKGIVLGFDAKSAQVIVLDNYMSLKKGDLVRIIDTGMRIPVGEKLLGRVIDPMGRPLDGLGEVATTEQGRYIESPAKPVYKRAVINRPLHTGYLIVDSQIPIGLGQRELLLGEKKVGNNDLAVEVICNQTLIKSDVISIYVAIDAETSATKRRVERLQATGALANTIVIVARTSESASINYIAPMVGVTTAEWFASKKKDVLLVFDNLTSHAKVYRQLSLLLNRPASREAYPGDIFYLHSRLLERCGAFNEQGGGGTITALPIVETQGDEVTDFITTNLMSITDGHILFRQSLVNKGMQPAIDSGFSVSRIGGRAQQPLMRELSDALKQIIIGYNEVERFMSFGSDLHGDTLETIELGSRAFGMFYQATGTFYTPYQEVLLSYFIVSKKALRWQNDQMETVKAELFAFVEKGEGSKLSIAAFSKPSLEEAKPFLDKVLSLFEVDPSTSKPIEKERPLTAETETITGILRDNVGESHDQA